MAAERDHLAIIREVNGRDDWSSIGHVRKFPLSLCSRSPDGAHVAYLEHPARYDNRGELAVVDLTGRKSVLSPEYWGLEGVAWSPDGSEVLFSGGLGFAQFVVHGATLSGRVRVVLESAGGLNVYDVARDGRWLASRDDVSRVMMVKGPGMSEERDLSWLEFSAPVGFSRDGRMLLFREDSGAVGDRYAVCLRQSDGRRSFAR